MDSEKLKLCDIAVNTYCRIIKVLSSGLSKQRMLDLGIIPGTKILVLRKSFSGDPTAYLIRDTVIALRKEESENILVNIL